MAISIGDNGGIRVAEESVAYGTAGTVWAVQKSVSATEAPVKPLLDIPCLGNANPTTRRYGVSSVNGENTVCYSESRAIIGPYLAAAGNLATDTYTFGAGTAPDVASITTWVDYGDYAMQFTGDVITGIRWEFQPDSAVTLTPAKLGQAFSKETSVTLTPPAETSYIWDSDLGAISVGGTALGFLSGTIEVTFPVVGPDRHTLGGATIRQPRTTGRAVVTGSFNVELDDSTGVDSVAILDLWNAGTTLGSVVLGDWTITNCWMTGDQPALGTGITQFPINVTGNTLAVVTTA